MAAYTVFEKDSKKQAQGISFSHDGKTFHYYEGNPVLDLWSTEFRDPTVFWHEPTAKWVMVITLSCADHWLLGRDGDYRFGFFSSADQKQWEELSRFDMPRGLDCCAWPARNTAITCSTARSRASGAVGASSGRAS